MEEKYMLKLLKELGNMYGHSDVEIVEIEELGIIALQNWNGFEYFDCYQCNKFGEMTGQDGITLKPVQEPISYDNDGEPEQWETVGYDRTC